MALVKGKQCSWKKQIYLGLQAAHSKLTQYYKKTYQLHGVIYAVTTILDPYQKLNAFCSASWADDTEKWEEHYLQIIKKIFAYYSDHFPATEEEPYQPLQLSGLNWVWHHSKHCWLSSSWHQNISGQQFRELQRYLDENGK